MTSLPSDEGPTTRSLTDISEGGSSNAPNISQRQQEQETGSRSRSPLTSSSPILAGGAKRASDAVSASVVEVASSTGRVVPSLSPSPPVVLQPVPNDSNTIQKGPLAGAGASIRGSTATTPSNSVVHIAIAAVPPSVAIEAQVHASIPKGAGSKKAENISLVAAGGDAAAVASTSSSSSTTTTTTSLPDLTPAVFRNSKLRSGKWLKEEEEYAEALRELFESGIASDCVTGCTLRAYLSKKLHCPPMRISKKFAGKGIGKTVFLSKLGLDSSMPKEQMRLLEVQTKEKEERFYNAALSCNEFGAQLGLMFSSGEIPLPPPGQAATALMRNPLYGQLGSTPSPPVVLTTTNPTSGGLSGFPTAGIIRASISGPMASSGPQAITHPLMPPTSAATAAPLLQAPPFPKTMMQLPADQLSPHASAAKTPSSMSLHSSITSHAPSGGVNDQTLKLHHSFLHALQQQQQQPWITSDKGDSSYPNAVPIMGGAQFPRSAILGVPMFSTTYPVGVTSVPSTQIGGNSVFPRGTSEPSATALPWHPSQMTMLNPATAKPAPDLSLASEMQPPAGTAMPAAHTQRTLLVDPHKDLAASHGPDFLSGFDQVALKLKQASPADGTCVGANAGTMSSSSFVNSQPPAIAPLLPPYHDEPSSNFLHCSPPVSSRSFDDFHRFLGQEEFMSLDSPVAKRGVSGSAPTVIGENGMTIADNNSNGPPLPRNDNNISNCSSSNPTLGCNSTSTVASGYLPGTKQSLAQTKVPDINAVFSAESYAMFASAAVAASSQHAAYYLPAGAMFGTTHNGLRDRPDTFDVERTVNLVSAHVGGLQQQRRPSSSSPSAATAAAASLDTSGRERTRTYHCSTVRFPRTRESLLERMYGNHLVSASEPSSSSATETESGRGSMQSSSASSANASSNDSADANAANTEDDSTDFDNSDTSDSELESSPRPKKARTTITTKTAAIHDSLLQGRIRHGAKK